METFYSIKDSSDYPWSAHVLSASLNLIGLIMMKKLFFFPTWKFLDQSLA